MELVTRSMRQKIITGKDVNLAALLIPSFDFSKDDDKKLTSSLNIVQFMRAFGRYKRVMCETYVDRMQELDRYEALIHDIHHLHGEKFYDYHKLFSMKSSNALQVHRIKLDWSKRDTEIYHQICAYTSSPKCSKCGEFSHSTQFCPSLPKLQQLPVANASPQYPVNNRQNADMYGRSRVFHQNMEVCNNFNAKGCSRHQCSRLHVCAKCRQDDHNLQSCPMQSSVQSQNGAHKKRST